MAIRLPRVFLYQLQNLIIDVQSGLMSFGFVFDTEILVVEAMVPIPDDSYFKQLKVEISTASLDALRNYTAKNRPIIARKITFEIRQNDIDVFTKMPFHVDELVTTLDELRFSVSPRISPGPVFVYHLLQDPSYFRSAQAKKIDFYLDDDLPNDDLPNELSDEKLLEFLCDQNAPAANREFAELLFNRTKEPVQILEKFYSLFSGINHPEKIFKKFLIGYESDSEYLADELKKIKGLKKVPKKKIPDLVKKFKMDNPYLMEECFEAGRSDGWKFYVVCLTYEDASGLCVYMAPPEENE
uniref:Uncharacterized protein n=1 Tax=Acrobeloides nanus TaxID=290746 RepID=A0A914EL30_9BILA